MTRKHYEMLVRAIRAADLTPDSQTELVRCLSYELQRDNPRFNPVKFTAALKESKV